jgi:hypothetical protein
LPPIGSSFHLVLELEGLCSFSSRPIPNPSVGRGEAAPSSVIELRFGELAASHPGAGKESSGQPQSVKPRIWRNLEPDYCTVLGLDLQLRIVIATSDYLLLFQLVTPN